MDGRQEVLIRAINSAISSPTKENVLAMMNMVALAFRQGVGIPGALILEVAEQVEKDNNYPSQERLAKVLRHFGWGPKEGYVEFKREGNGWRLGNGVVTRQWKDTKIPQDPIKALIEIEAELLPWPGE